MTRHLTAGLTLLILVLALANSAIAAQQCKDNPTGTGPGDSPCMTIKIFNRSGRVVYPVVSMGIADTADQWLQGFFAVTQGDLETRTYQRNLIYRIYINPTSGIAMNQGITLTVPLYTQMVIPSGGGMADGKTANQYINWWKGGTIQVFDSRGKRAVQDDLNNRGPDQQPLGAVPDMSIAPYCSGELGGDCTLELFSDKTDLLQSGPSQLLEHTLGALINLAPTDNSQRAFDLDVANVDFDLSYVNTAYLPATLGPYQNNQVGWVGTPQPIRKFINALNNFLGNPTLPITSYAGWPQFITTYHDGQSPPTETILKLPSPLVIFPLLTQPNPPADLTPPEGGWPSMGRWQAKLWPPIKTLFDNWKMFAGGADNNPPAKCPRSAGDSVTFCDFLLDVKDLFLANYDNYLATFPTGQGCKGTQPTLKVPTDEDLVAHVYGWTPFNANCPANFNLLQNTPGYADNQKAKYTQVKHEFDKLNYGKALVEPKYVFNPWVKLIHGAQFVNAANVYAYSVDDAVGNVQAEGHGFIVDIVTAQDQENQNPAQPPISISLGFGANDQIKFTQYKQCQNGPWKPVLPSFPGFSISAQDPKNCPVYLRDNKSTPQLYTFTVTDAPKNPPPPFTYFTAAQKAQDPSPVKWIQSSTATYIDCTGNPLLKNGDNPVCPNDQNFDGSACYQPSSAEWCCLILPGNSGNGTFAYTTDDPDSIHSTYSNFVPTNSAATNINRQDLPDTFVCSKGQPR